MELTLIVVILYIVGALVLGLFLKSAKSSQEYSTSNNSLGAVAISIGLVMTMYGGGFVLAGAELSYKYGWFGAAYGIAAAMGMLILGLLLGKKIHYAEREFNIKTIPSLLHMKFNNKYIALLSALLSIAALTAIASAQLFASTRIFTALGLPVNTSLIITTFIVILVATKGMTALTNSGKYNIIIASIGGIAAIFATIKTENVTPFAITGFQSISPTTLAWLVIPTILYTLIGQDIHQKLYSAKNKRTILIGCIMATILLGILSIFPTIIGMQGRYLFDIPATEVVPQFIIYTLPSVLEGLFIAAILAAVIGCAQSVINAASTQVSEDLFKPLGFRDKVLNKIPQLSALALSLIALLITLFSSSIINNLIVAYSLYTSGMFVPVIGAFFMKFPWKRKNSVVLIAVTGIIVSGLIEFNLLHTKIPSIIIGISSSFLILIFMMLFENVYFKISGNNK